MKINPPTEAVRFHNMVQERREGQSGRHPQDQRKEEGSAEPQTEEAASDDKVGAALQAFACDSQTKAAGLSAAITGKGPGLRVVLTDVSGNVIRQFTGEEFLRLRQTASPSLPARGKILDQKL